LIVFTLLDTGLRVAELAGLTRDNVDWQAHRLVIHGKGGKRRVVPTSPRSWVLLERWFADRRTVGAGRRTLQRLVRGVANRARIGRPCSPHVLRHTFAVTCLQKGVTLAAVGRLLGHESLETTMMYLNLSNEEALREHDAKW
jgi:integrase/recombinase XerD